MNRIEDAVFCILDLETASISDGRPVRICEIGAIKTAQGKELGRFQTLVNPETPVTGDAFRIHRISDTMVRGAPCFKEVAGELLEFIKGTILIAHNTAFDVRVINQELKRVGLAPWTGPSIDTVRLGRKAFQGLPSYSLDGLARFFDLEFSERHRAIGDCEVTMKVFWKCVDQLLDTKKVRTLTDLLKLGRNRAAERNP